MKRTSTITHERAKLSRQHRFNPIKGLTPAKLASALEEFKAGNLRRAALLWDAQQSRNPTLCSVSRKRVKSPARCPWEVMVSEETPRAKEHAAALRWFYNNIQVTSANDPSEQGGFALLVRQMLSAIGMKYAIHELVLRPRRANGVELPLDTKDNTVGYFKPDTLVTAELRFCPLWWFENRNGPLAYIKTDWEIEGEPLKRGEWVVTVGDGLMEASSVADMFQRMSLQDWVAFNEKFGMPGLLGLTSAQPETPEHEAMKEALRDIANDWAGVISGSDDVRLLEVKGSGAGPFAPLVNQMDRYMATLWRGGDLSTLSGSKPGDNTGASLQGGEELILVEDDCQLVSETLNEQIDKVVIRYLFGEEPLAYVKLIAPKPSNLDAVIKTVDFLTKYDVPVGVNQLRERVAMPAPADKEALLKAPKAPSALGRGGQPGR